MKFIERTIASQLIQAFKKYPIITLTGARQAGKSTLLQKTFPELPFVNLESINTRNLALEDPEGFLDQYNNGAIFDEVQRVPDLFSAIQVLVDKVGKESMFVLSGSQNFLLLEKVSQSLAGRTVVFHLPPFSMSELHNIADRDLNVQMYTGGYPRIYDKNLNPSEWLDSYIQTFIERDIRSLKNVSDLEQFRLFVQMCAARSGQVLDLNSLGNDCGITGNTAKSWLSLLETSFITFRLRPYHKNFNKRLIKSSKLYFWDSGLLCYLLKIRKPHELAIHANRGNVFETYIISEIKKYFLINNLSFDVYFWRDKVCEVDCLIETGLDEFVGVEIKSGRTYNTDYRKSLDYLKKVSNRRYQSAIIYSGDECQSLPGDIELLPHADVFSFLKKRFSPKR